MTKKVFYDDDARRRVLGGAQILYDAVKTTMGPKGRNVIIGGHVPTVTHDGVTVAKGVDIADVDDETLGYKVGADLIKQAASKLNDVAGDGTTTVTVLTYHILNEANKLIAAGHSPMELRKELDQAAASIADRLAKLAEPVEPGSDRIAQIGSISAGDKEIGDLIAQVIGYIGKDGVVTVEAGQGLALESEIAEGFTFDRGFMSPYMVTDATRMEAVYENTAIVITNRSITNVTDLMPLMEKLVQSGKKSMLLIAADIGGEALGTLILNTLKGTFRTVAVKAPGFGDRQTAILEDIAALTGAQVITENDDLEALDTDIAGTIRKAIVDKDSTTIVKADNDSEALTARIKMLAEQEAAGTDVEFARKRRADLEGKVAIIRVGGTTETEIDEKKYRVDDAVAAVKAALAEGIVPGGGVTPLMLAKDIKGDDNGSKLLRNAFEQPFRILLENANLKPDAWITQVKNVEGYGIDVSDSEPELIDLKEAGVIDPARVTREAIQNAVSIAGTAMTMGALVVDVPEPYNPLKGLGGMQL